MGRAGSTISKFDELQCSMHVAMKLAIAIAVGLVLVFAINSTQVLHNHGAASSGSFLGRRLAPEFCGCQDPVKMLPKLPKWFAEKIEKKKLDEDGLAWAQSQCLIFTGAPFTTPSESVNNG